MRRLLSTLFVSCFASFATSTYASDWKFSITPYLWAINLNGNVQVGPTKATINDSFSDILHHLNIGGMLWATAHKDKLGFYFNGLYAALSDSGEFGSLHVQAHNYLGIYGIGVSYTTLQKPNLFLEPYLGARFTVNNTHLNVNQFSASLDKSWCDPVVGLQFDYRFNHQWDLLLAGDIGGTNATTDYSYSANALFGFQPKSWKSTKVGFGYRLLHQRYATGSGLHYYRWDMNLFGPVLGVTFSF